MADEKNADADPKAEAEDNIDDQVTDSVSQEDDGIDPEDGIEELKRSLAEQKRQVEEAQRLRAEAEQRAYQAQIEAQRSSQEAKNANYNQIVGTINQLSEREKSLMAAWAEAKSKGDYQKEAEIQKEMLVTANYLERLNKGKDALENEMKRPVQPVAPPIADPIEDAASRMSPSSAAWIRAHRDFLSTGRNDLLVKAAHTKSQALGITVDTPDYFAFIEEEVGLRGAPRRSAKRDDDYEDDDGPMSSASAPQSRRSVSPPSAPVSRGGQRRGTITLSAEEREIAKISGLTDEQYYANKMRDKKRAS